MMFTTLILAVTNFLTLSFGAGEANNLRYGQSHGTAVSTNIGGAGNVGFAYELHYRRFIFGLGLEGQYQYTRDDIADFTDLYPFTDRNGETIQYGYHVLKGQEGDHSIRLSVPISFGAQVGDRGYVLAGVKVGLPMFNRYSTTLNMRTEGHYPFGIEPVWTEGANDFTRFGYYAADTYTYSADYVDYLSVSGTLEAGAYLRRRPTTKVRMRMGAYAEYGMRIQSVKGISASSASANTTGNLLNADNVTLYPAPVSQDNLRENLILYPAMSTALYDHLPHNLEVGIRFTVLFHITVDNDPCMCEAPAKRPTLKGGTHGL